MSLKRLSLSGFKSFAKPTTLEFTAPITAVVGPNGSGKSNIADAFRFALGEQSMKSLRGGRTEDMIFNGSKTAPRSNRAHAELVLCNKARTFAIDFDEVILERVVHRDATNEYKVNGSIVRLKDKYELISTGNIGPSGHHIITQGEADRLLSSSPLERRTLIEDALGLRLYHFRKREAEQNLTKTLKNLEEASMARSLLEPDLRLAKRELARLESAEKIRTELVSDVHTYLAQKESFLEHEKKQFDAQALELQKKHQEVTDRLERLESEKDKDPEKDLRPVRSELNEVQEKIRGYEREIEEKQRALGVIEGKLELLSRPQKRPTSCATLSHEDVEDVVRKIEGYQERVVEEDNREVRSREFSSLITTTRHGLESFFGVEEEESIDTTPLVEEKTTLEKHIKDCIERRQKLEDERMTLEDRYRKVEREVQSRGVHLIEAQNEYNDVERSLRRCREELERVKEETHRFTNECAEIGGILGPRALRFRKEDYPHEGAITWNSLSSLEREVYRKLAKVEDTDFSALGELTRTVEELGTQHDYLSKEIEDLEGAEQKTRDLIRELEGLLEEEFTRGVEKINSMFNEFFGVMFGGGSAELTLVEIPDKGVGLDINVDLPFKAIRGIQVLSGGERALTSIALLCSIALLNPPPFMILDETDAALDEANSQKYGNMLERLSGSTQLIVITHNRETMARAHLLYGVTMGSDGISRLLSINLADAVAHTNE